MLLGDMARVSDGKLDVLGAGWAVATVPTNFGVGLLVDVPWSALGGNYHIEVKLQTAEGDVVLNDSGDPLLSVSHDLNPHRPPGVVLGLPATGAMAWNFGGVPLVADRQYRLQASVNGQDDPAAGVTFSTVASLPGQIAV
jgi:hypothetical protein